MPFLSSDRWQRDNGGGAPLPLVFVAKVKGVSQLAAVDSRALAVGLRAGMTLADARARMIEFGKFHGHTLGQIADFEPTYIDWLARTISRDPDLVAAARAIQAYLDERGIVREPRPAPT